MRAILVLLHIEAVTRALPEPFSGSSPKAERREMYISTHERAHPCILVVSAVSSFYSSFFPSFTSPQRVVRLIIAVMPRGVKVYTTRPLVVDESTTRSILPDRCSPLSYDVDGTERESIPLRDYDIVINRCYRATKTELQICTAAERFYVSNTFFSVNFYCVC